MNPLDLHLTDKTILDIVSHGVNLYEFSINPFAEAA